MKMNGGQDDLAFRSSLSGLGAINRSTGVTIPDGPAARTRLGIAN